MNGGWREGEGGVERWRGREDEEYERGEYSGREERKRKLAGKNCVGVVTYESP